MSTGGCHARPAAGRCTLNASLAAVRAEQTQTQMTSPVPAAMGLAASRSGKKLWATAKARHHAYHSVTHQLQHRGGEKMVVALAEYSLHWAASRAAQVLIAHGDVAVARTGGVQALWRVVWRKPLEVARRASGWVRRRTRRLQQKVSTETMHVAAHATAAHHVRGLGRALDVLSVAMPLIAGLLIAHMASHDLQRAMRESRASRSSGAAVALFWLGTVCDALDALVHVALALMHAVVAFGLAAHLDHSVEHWLHDVSLAMAVAACFGMATGEIICVWRDGGRHHGQQRGNAAPLQMQIRRLAQQQAQATEAAVGGAEGSRGCVAVMRSS